MILPYKCSHMDQPISYKKDMEQMDLLQAFEMIVDKEAWPMPSYGDLMFEV